MRVKRVVKKIISIILLISIGFSVVGCAENRIKPSKSTLSLVEPKNKQFSVDKIPMAKYTVPVKNKMGEEEAMEFTWPWYAAIGGKIQNESGVFERAAAGQVDQSTVVGLATRKYFLWSADRAEAIRVAMRDSIDWNEIRKMLMEVAGEGNILASLTPLPPEVIARQVFRQNIPPELRSIEAVIKKPKETEGNSVVEAEPNEVPALEQNLAEEPNGTEIGIPPAIATVESAPPALEAPDQTPVPERASSVKESVRPERPSAPIAEAERDGSAKVEAGKHDSMKPQSAEQIERLRKIIELVEKHKTVENEVTEAEKKMAIAEEELMIGITGLIIEETMTKIGYDFYEYFFLLWEAPEEIPIKDYNIIINEKASPMWGSWVQVQVDDRIVWNSVLRPRSTEIEDAAKEAIEATKQYLVNYEQYQFQTDDMVGTGI